MHHAGIQYGQGNIPSNSVQYNNVPELSVPSNIPTPTATLRQWRKKEPQGLLGSIDKSPLGQDQAVAAATAAAPESQGPIARVAPQAHYPRPTEPYRYPAHQYNGTDYGLNCKDLSPTPVKYSEIVEPAHSSTRLDHHLNPIIQKAKEKEYLEMCSVQHTQMNNMKHTYPNVHPGMIPPPPHQYKESHMHHPSAAFAPYHIPPNYKMNQYQRQYGNEGNFPLQFINEQQFYPVEQRGYQNHHHQRMYRTQAAPAPSSYRAQSYANAMPGYNYKSPAGNHHDPYGRMHAIPHTMQKYPLDSRRVYPENLSNYPTTRVSPPNYAQCNQMEYAQHYQNRRHHDYLQQQDLKLPYPVQGHMPDIVTENTPKPSLKQFLETWNDDIPDIQDGKTETRGGKESSLYILDSTEIPTENVQQFLHLQVDKLPENIKFLSADAKADGETSADGGGVKFLGDKRRASPVDAAEKIRYNRASAVGGQCAAIPPGDSAKSRVLFNRTEEAPPLDPGGNIRYDNVNSAKHLTQELIGDSIQRNQHDSAKHHQPALSENIRYVNSSLTKTPTEETARNAEDARIPKDLTFDAEVPALNPAHDSSTVIRTTSPKISVISETRRFLENETKKPEASEKNTVIVYNEKKELHMPQLDKPVDDLGVIDELVKSTTEFLPSVGELPDLPFMESSAKNDARLTPNGLTESCDVAIPAEPTDTKLTAPATDIEANIKTTPPTELVANMKTELDANLKTISIEDNRVLIKIAGVVLEVEVTNINETPNIAITPHAECVINANKYAKRITNSDEAKTAEESGFQMDEESSQIQPKTFNNINTHGVIDGDKDGRVSSQIQTDDNTNMDSIIGAEENAAVLEDCCNEGKMDTDPKHHLTNECENNKQETGKNVIVDNQLNIPEEETNSPGGSTSATEDILSDQINENNSDATENGTDKSPLPNITHEAEDPTADNTSADLHDSSENVIQDPPGNSNASPEEDDLHFDETNETINVPEVDDHKNASRVSKVEAAGDCNSLGTEGTAFDELYAENDESVCTNADTADDNFVPTSEDDPVCVSDVSQQVEMVESIEQQNPVEEANKIPSIETETNLALNRQIPAADLPIDYSMGDEPEDTSSSECSSNESDTESENDASQTEIKGCVEAEASPEEVDISLENTIHVIAHKNEKKSVRFLLDNEASTKDDIFVAENLEGNGCGEVNVRRNEEINIDPENNNVNSETPLLQSSEKQENVENGCNSIRTVSTEETNESRPIQDNQSERNSPKTSEHVARKLKTKESKKKSIDSVLQRVIQMQKIKLMEKEETEMKRVETLDANLKHELEEKRDLSNAVEETVDTVVENVNAANLSDSDTDDGSGGNLNESGIVDSLPIESETELRQSLKTIISLNPQRKNVAKKPNIHLKIKLGEPTKVQTPEKLSDSEEYESEDIEIVHTEENKIKFMRRKTKCEKPKTPSYKRKKPTYDERYAIESNEANRLKLCRMEKRKVSPLKIRIKRTRHNNEDSEESNDCEESEENSLWKIKTADEHEEEAGAENVYVSKACDENKLLIVKKDSRQHKGIKLIVSRSCSVNSNEEVGKSHEGGYKDSNEDELLSEKDPEQENHKRPVGSEDTEVNNQKELVLKERTGNQPADAENENAFMDTREDEDNKESYNDNQCNNDKVDIKEQFVTEDSDIQPPENNTFTPKSEDFNTNKPFDVGANTTTAEKTRAQSVIQYPLEEHPSKQLDVETMREKSVLESRRTDEERSNEESGGEINVEDGSNDESGRECSEESANEKSGRDVSCEDGQNHKVGRESFEEVSNDKSVRERLEESQNDKSGRDVSCEESRNDKSGRECFEESPNDKSGRDVSCEESRNDKSGRECFEESPNDKSARECFEESPNDNSGREYFEESPNDKSARECFDESPNDNSGRECFEESRNDKSAREINLEESANDKSGTEVIFEESRYNHFGNHAISDDNILNESDRNCKDVLETECPKDGKMTDENNPSEQAQLSEKVNEDNNREFGNNLDNLERTVDGDLNEAERNEIPCNSNEIQMNLQQAEYGNNSENITENPRLEGEHPEVDVNAKTNHIPKNVEASEGDMKNNEERSGTTSVIFKNTAHIPANIEDNLESRPGIIVALKSANKILQSAESENVGHKSVIEAVGDVNIEKPKYPARKLSSNGEESDENSTIISQGGAEVTSMYECVKDLQNRDQFPKTDDFEDEDGLEVMTSNLETEEKRDETLKQVDNSDLISTPRTEDNTETSIIDAFNGPDDHSVDQEAVIEDDSKKSENRNAQKNGDVIKHNFNGSESQKIEDTPFTTRESVDACSLTESAEECSFAETVSEQTFEVYKEFKEEHTSEFKNSNCDENNGIPRCDEEIRTKNTEVIIGAKVLNGEKNNEPQEGFIGLEEQDGSIIASEVKRADAEDACLVVGDLINETVIEQPLDDEIKEDVYEEIQLTVFYDETGSPPMIPLDEEECNFEDIYEKAPDIMVIENLEQAVVNEIEISDQVDEFREEIPLPSKDGCMSFTVRDDGFDEIRYFEKKLVVRLKPEDEYELANYMEKQRRSRLQNRGVRKRKRIRFMNLNSEEDDKEEKSDSMQAKMDAESQMDSGNALKLNELVSKPVDYCSAAFPEQVVKKLHIKKVVQNQIRSNDMLPQHCVKRARQHDSPEDSMSKLFMEIDEPKDDKKPMPCKSLKAKNKTNNQKQMLKLKQKKITCYSLKPETAVETPKQLKLVLKREEKDGEKTKEESSRRSKCEARNRIVTYKCISQNSEEGVPKSADKNREEARANPCASGKVRLKGNQDAKQRKTAKQKNAEESDKLDCKMLSHNYSSDEPNSKSPPETPNQVEQDKTRERKHEQNERKHEQNESIKDAETPMSDPNEEESKKIEIVSSKHNFSIIKRPKKDAPKIRTPSTRNKKNLDLAQPEEEIVPIAQKPPKVKTKAELKIVARPDCSLVKSILKKALPHEPKMKKRLSLEEYNNRKRSCSSESEKSNKGEESPKKQQRIEHVEEIVNYTYTQSGGCLKTIRGSDPRLTSRRDSANPRGCQSHEVDEVLDFEEESSSFWPEINNTVKQSGDNTLKIHCSNETKQTQEKIVGSHFTPANSVKITKEPGEDGCNETNSSSLLVNTKPIDDVVDSFNESNSSFLINTTKPVEDFQERFNESNPSMALTSADNSDVPSTNIPIESTTKRPESAETIAKEPEGNAASNVQNASTEIYVEEDAIQTSPKRMNEIVIDDGTCTTIPADRNEESLLEEDNEDALANNNINISSVDEERLLNDDSGDYVADLNTRDVLEEAKASEERENSFIKTADSNEANGSPFGGNDGTLRVPSPSAARNASPENVLQSVPSPGEVSSASSEKPLRSVPSSDVTEAASARNASPEQLCVPAPSVNQAVSAGSASPEKLSVAPLDVMEADFARNASPEQLCVPSPRANEAVSSGNASPEKLSAPSPDLTEAASARNASPEKYDYNPMDDKQSNQVKAPEAEEISRRIDDIFTLTFKRKDNARPPKRKDIIDLNDFNESIRTSRIKPKEMIIDLDELLPAAARKLSRIDSEEDNMCFINKPRPDDEVDEEENALVLTRPIQEDIAGKSDLLVDEDSLEPGEIASDDDSEIEDVQNNESGAHKELPEGKCADVDLKPPGQNRKSFHATSFDLSELIPSRRINKHVRILKDESDECCRLSFDIGELISNMNSKTDKYRKAVFPVGLEEEEVEGGFEEGPCDLRDYLTKNKIMRGQQFAFGEEVEESVSEVFHRHAPNSRIYRNRRRSHERAPINRPSTSSEDIGAEACSNFKPEHEMGAVSPACNGEIEENWKIGKVVSTVTGTIPARPGFGEGRKSSRNSSNCPPSFFTQKRGGFCAARQRTPFHEGKRCYSSVFETINNKVMKQYEETVCGDLRKHVVRHSSEGATKCKSNTPKSSRFDHANKTIDYTNKTIDYTNKTIDHTTKTISSKCVPTSGFGSFNNQPIIGSFNKQQNVASKCTPTHNFCLFNNIKCQYTLKHDGGHFFNARQNNQSRPFFQPRPFFNCKQMHRPQRFGGVNFNQNARPRHFVPRGFHHFNSERRFGTITRRSDESNFAQSRPEVPYSDYNDTASLNNLTDIRTTLEVPFGSNNLTDIRTRLEVPFGSNNLTDIRTKLEVPFGGNNLTDIRTRLEVPFGGNNLTDIRNRVEVPFGGNNLTDIRTRLEVPFGSNNDESLNNPTDIPSRIEVPFNDNNTGTSAFPRKPSSDLTKDNNRNDRNIDVIQCKSEICENDGDVDSPRNETNEEKPHNNDNHDSDGINPEEDKTELKNPINQSVEALPSPTNNKPVSIEPPDYADCDTLELEIQSDEELFYGSEEAAEDNRGGGTYYEEGEVWSNDECSKEDDCPRELEETRTPLPVENGDESNSAHNERGTFQMNRNNKQKEERDCKAIKQHDKNYKTITLQPEERMHNYNAEKQKEEDLLNDKCTKQKEKINYKAITPALENERADNMNIGDCNVKHTANEAENNEGIARNRNEILKKLDNSSKAGFSRIETSEGREDSEGMAKNTFRFKDNEGVAKGREGNERAAEDRIETSEGREGNEGMAKNTFRFKDNEGVAKGREDNERAAEEGCITNAARNEILKLGNFDNAAFKDRIEASEDFILIVDYKDKTTYKFSKNCDEIPNKKGKCEALDFRGGEETRNNARDFSACDEDQLDFEEDLEEAPDFNEDVEDLEEDLNEEADEIINENERLEEAPDFSEDAEEMIIKENDSEDIGEAEGNKRQLIEVADEMNIAETSTNSESSQASQILSQDGKQSRNETNQKQCEEFKVTSVQNANDTNAENKEIVQYKRNPQRAETRVVIEDSTETMHSSSLEYKARSVAGNSEDTMISSNSALNKIDVTEDIAGKGTKMIVAKRRLPKRNVGGSFESHLRANGTRLEVAARKRAAINLAEAKRNNGEEANTFLNHAEDS